MILKRYIVREQIAPFLLSLLVVIFVLLIDRIIDLLNLILEKKLDAGTILQVFALSLPFMLALAIPMAVLVATILSFGRMSVDRETVAIKASGVSIYQLIGPLLVLALLLTGGMIYFNHYTLPEMNHKLKNLMLKIAYYKPMTIVKAGEFTNFSDYTIYVKENLKTELRGIVVYDRSESRFPKIISAKRGQIFQRDRGNSLQIILYDGEMHERNEREPGKYQVRSFGRFILNIRDLTYRIDYIESEYRSDREMTAKELLSGIRSSTKDITAKHKVITDFQRRLNVLKFSPMTSDNKREELRLGTMLKMEQDRISDLEETKRSYEVEYHKKYAIAFAIVIFVLIGIPLGLMTRSSGIGMAFSVSSLIFLIYYVSLNGGEQLADKGYVSPFLAMWISNFIFLVIAVLLIISSIYEKRLVDLHTFVWRLSNPKLRKAEIPDEVIH